MTSVELVAIALVDTYDACSAREVFDGCKKASAQLNKPELAQDLFEIVWPEFGPLSVNGLEHTSDYEPDLDHIVYEMKRLFA